MGQFTAKLCAGRLPVRPTTNRRARHPGDDALVTFFDMCDTLTNCAHDTSSFMTEQQRPAESAIVHLVKLRMTHATRIQFHQHLSETRIGKFQFIDEQRLTGVDLNGSFGLHLTASVVRYYQAATIGARAKGWPDQFERA